VRNWRVLTAIAAVVLAALAGVLVWKYTQDAKNDAKKPYTSVEVLVADKSVPINSSFSSALDNKQIVRAQRVQRDLPSGYVSGESNDDQLKSQFKQLIASHNIVQGQTIVSSDFVAQGDVQSSLAGTLNTDQAKDKTNELVAVTVSFDDVHGVGGFLQPGDSVNAVFSGKIGDLTDANPDRTKVQATTYFMPGLKIIAVGSSTETPAQTAAAASASGGTASSPAEQGNRALITFEVTPRQSEQLIQATATGPLYLTLNPPSFKPGDFKDPGEIVEAINLFDKDLPLVKDTIAKLKAAGK
jgi:Flp pilus assembly protein CpaB